MTNTRRRPLLLQAAAVVIAVAGCGIVPGLDELSGVRISAERSEYRLTVRVAEWPVAATTVVSLCPGEPEDTTAEALAEAHCLEVGRPRATGTFEHDVNLESLSSAQFLEFDAADTWYVALVATSSDGASRFAVVQSIPGAPVERPPG